MEFSESFRYTEPGPYFSPNAKFLAVPIEYRLIIRDVETLQVVQLYNCLDRIQHLEWSPSSLYVLCGLYNRSVVQIWSVDQPGWTCKIDEAPAGILRAIWCPDGLGVLLIANFQIRMTMWSLLEKKCLYMKGPKQANSGICFSSDGRILAVLEREDCKDYITVYDAKLMVKAKHFHAHTSDAADIFISPDNCHLAVLDSVLVCRLLVYTLSGECLVDFAPYREALGFRCVAWSPSGDLLAAGDCNQTVHVLNTSTWQPLLQWTHLPHVSGPSNVLAYKEVSNHQASMSPSSKDMPNASKSQKKAGAAPYALQELPLTIPTPKAVKQDGTPKLGIGLLVWSADGRFLASVNDNCPTAVWIWEIASTELYSIVIQANPISDLAWLHKDETLVICSSSGCCYLWSPEHATVVQVPEQHFRSRKVLWSPSGKALILKDKDRFCCVSYNMENAYES